MRKLLSLLLIVAFSFSIKAQTITPIKSIQQISSSMLAMGRDTSLFHNDTVWIEGLCMFDPCNYAQSGQTYHFAERVATFLMDTAGGAWSGIEVLLDPGAIGMTPTSAPKKDSVAALDGYVGFQSGFQYGFKVKCRGIVSNFGGNTQFVLLKTPAVPSLATTALPSPITVTIDSFEKLNTSSSLQDIQLQSGEKYEGTYVEIKNPIITNVNPNYSVSGLNGGTRYRYDIKDAAGNTMTVQDNFSGIFCNTKFDMFCHGNDPANPVSNTPTPYVGYSNGTVLTYIRGYIGEYTNLTSGVKFYTIAPLRMSDIGSQTFAPPVIANVRINPGNPTPTQAVSLKADITDDSTVTSVKCFYAFGLNNTSWTSMNMTLGSGITYSATIPATITDSVWVKYYIKAVDNFGHTSYYTDTLGTNNYYLSIHPISKISEIQSRATASGKSIYTGDTLKGISVEGIVTATAQTDDLGLVTIQDGTNPYSGIALSGASVTHLHRGEKIQITKAVVNEVNGTSITSSTGMTTLDNPTFTIVSSNNTLPLPITTVSMDSIYNNRSAYIEPYEAMLIGFNNVVVSDTNPDWAASHTTFGEWAVYNTVGSVGARCDDFSNDISATFYKDSLHVGQSICYINGIVQYAHSNWKILLIFVVSVQITQRKLIASIFLQLLQLLLIKLLKL